jgi:phospholipase C
VTLDRRQFMQRAGILGGAVAAGSALAGCDWFKDWPGGGPLGSILDLPASSAPVDHVVVVMMENRSFDHYLGWLAEDPAYLAAGRSRYGRRFRIDGDQSQSYPDPTGTPVPTAHLFEQAGQTNPWRGCGFEDPGHGWTSGRVQRDAGFLAAGSNNDAFALGYYEAPDLPITTALARRFTTFDSYHCSILGPTYPNREYLHSGQSGGNKTNAFPPTGDGFPWPIIWDKLAAASVPCRYYYSDLPTLALWGPRGLSYSSPIVQYYEACAAGTLPNVTFVDPSFIGELRNDDHPLADVRGGQDFIRDVFRAFVESPHWESGAFIVTYDEWGGFFDHVAPAHFADPRASTIDSEDFSQGGFRVPTLLASPFARPGFVDHRVYDHTSILRFIQWRFLGAKYEGAFRGSGAPWWLTWRDRDAFNIGASLARESVDVDVGFDLDQAIDPVSAPCGAAPGAAFRAQPNPAVGDDAFDELRWREYLDRAGLRVAALA